MEKKGVKRERASSDFFGAPRYFYEYPSAASTEHAFFCLRLVRVKERRSIHNSTLDLRRKYNTCEMTRTLGFQEELDEFAEGNSCSGSILQLMSTLRMDKSIQVNPLQATHFPK